ncbi:restriction endonuclease [Segetibacter sp. 3557_3]|uniref:nSTAND3 domain-containing NTPase n=1 Tax=Segetibacter sp. 3557_3 TaxID=2547429 RepID=UPI0014047138|nr:restriction endonuclease [Segetibacter sp. 3557_3]
MATYELEKLNDKEFEELSRDLLQKEMGVRFESFRRGKDKGIDLRHSVSEEDNGIIVQAKHYKGSGFNKLLNMLQREELAKVIKLNPSRYILITSVPLNPGEKDKIRAVFSKFIVSSADIYGEDDVNNSISRFPEVLRLHPKVYLASLQVLNEVLNAHIHSRSIDKIKDIQHRIHLFVANEKYSNAVEIINEDHFLIITGEPGIGKTSLANFISFQHLAEGFRFTYILSDLTDAEKLLTNDEKELFFFDDFLGANYLRIKHSPHHDAMLLNFIGRVRTSKNKRLILTTRTTILNQARADFEKLKNPTLDLAKHEIHISHYNDLHKAQILYNHVYHSSLDVAFLKIFMSNKSYQTIVKHPNYNPRLIEYITDVIRLKNVPAESYHKFILEKLDKPEDIWLDPYESQLSDAAKFLLQTLFTMPARTPEHQVQEAFNERVRYEVKTNGFQKGPNLFIRTLFDLLGGFIHRRAGLETSYLEFYNPSFADFMSNYLASNEEEVDQVLRSLLYTDQFKHAFKLQEQPDPGNINSLNVLFNDLFFVRTLSKVKVSRKKLMQHILPRLEVLKPINVGKSNELNLCSFLLTHFPLSDVGTYISTIYPYIEFSSVLYNQFQDLFTLITVLEDKEVQIAKLIDEDFDKIVWRMFEIAEYEDDFLRVKELFDEHSKSYESFRRKHGANLQAVIDSFWLRGEIDARLAKGDFSKIYDEEIMIAKLNQLEADVSRINEELELSPSPSFEKIFKWDYKEMIEENRLEYQEGHYKVRALGKNVAEDNLSTTDVIENLFDGLIDQALT